MQIRRDIERELQRIGEVIRQQVERELTAQGHKLTGAVYTDIENRVLNLAADTILQGWYPFYAQYLHKGVPAERIPYNPGSGAKKSLYIEALIRYAKARNMSDPRRAAFAIARKHKQEGMPTKASYRFSQTGQRLKFLDHVLSDPKIEMELFELIGRSIDVELTNFLSNEQRRIGSLKAAV